MTKYAVLTSDLQHAAAWKHEERRKAVTAFLPGIIDFLNQSRALNIPIIHLQLVIPLDDPRNDGVPSELSYATGTEGCKLLPEIYENSDIVLEKPKDSGFFQTDLDQRLRTMGVETIVLTGMQAQICIQTTAADAYFRDFKPIIPREGVVSTRADDVDRALQWLDGYCATVTSYDEILKSFEAANG